MILTVNGEDREFPEPFTLTALLEQLSLSSARVAVERNGKIVSSERFGETALEAGDRLEVVHFVGGG
jgi:thiamine biosynthesis protein ThiS